MSKKILPLWALIIFFSCNNPDNNKTVNKSTNIDSTAKGTFGYDLRFLNRYDSVIILKDDSGRSMVAVSSKYQAKVFTSSADGDTGVSFGWINYKAFDEKPNAHMNGYGGENRFWLGPEGGIFSLFFDKGKEMVFDNWHTPAPFDTESWKTISQSNSSVHMQKDMSLKNYAGTLLSILADRTISILDNNGIGAETGMSLPDSVMAVGYKAENSIKNTGSFDWDEKTGMPCIWMLDMFNPSPATTIIIPYYNNEKLERDVATTDYFGQIPADRIKYKDNILFFKADGKSRGKLGLTPQRAKPVAGSWDADNGILTIIQFDIDPNGKYLNQEWNVNKPPFSGDAVNAYNDGPLEDRSQMGPFYELESVSPAAFLKPGESLQHNHFVFHFMGSREKLNEIAQKVLGVNLDQAETVFK